MPERQYHEMYSWHQVRKELKKRKVNWTVAKKIRFKERDPFSGRIRLSEGIHVYLFNKEGRQVGYWTPITEILTICHTPCIWGDHINAFEYDYNEEAK